MVSFIDELKKEGNTVEQRLALQQIFQAYLVVNCWEKMHRRVRQWSFLGVIYQLYKISDGEVVQAYQRHWSTRDEAEAEARSDGLLVKYLADFFSPESGIYENILRSYPGRLANLHGLKQKLWIAQSITEMQSPKLTIYDESSCTDFHKFLVAILIAYAKSLHTLYSKGKKKEPSVVDSLNDFHRYAVLLYIVTESRAFRLHIGVLAHSRHLSLPQYHNINEYQSFGAAQELGWITGNGSGAMGKTAKAERKGKGNERGNEEEKKKWQGNNEGGREEEARRMNPAALSEVQDAEAEDAEAEDAAVSSVGIVKQMTADDLGTAYRKYIGIQVAHFGAATMLKRYSRHLSRTDPASTFEAPFITVKRLQGKISWSRVTQLLKDLAVDENTSGEIEDSERRWRQYEKVIWDIATLAPSAASKLFRKLIDGSGGSCDDADAEVMGAVHCELALAIILKFGKMLPTTDILTDHLRELLAVRNSKPLVYG